MHTTPSSFKVVLTWELNRIALLTFENHYPNRFERGGGKELAKSKMATPGCWVTELVKTALGRNKPRFGTKRQWWVWFCFWHCRKFLWSLLTPLKWWMNTHYHSILTLVLKYTPEIFLYSHVENLWYQYLV